MTNTNSLTGMIGTFIIFADLALGALALVSFLFRSVALLIMFSFTAGALLLVQGIIMLVAMHRQRTTEGIPDSQTAEAHAAAGVPDVQTEVAKRVVVKQMQKAAKQQVNQPQDIATSTIRCALCNAVMQKNKLTGGGWQLLCTKCGREVMVEPDGRRNITNMGDESKKTINKLLNRIGQGASNTHLVDMDRTGGTPEISDKS